MSIDMRRITKGKVKRPPRVLIYGADGVGKTRFAASAPDPLFIDANQGSDAYDVQRVVPDSNADCKALITAVERGEIKCKTLVLDAIGDVESLLHKELFPGSSVAEYEGGWGKGDNLAIAHAREILSQLERVWARGIGIVLVGHALVRTFQDPTGPSYDRFEIACRPRLAGQLRQWSDFVLFAREITAPNKTSTSANEKTRAITTGERVIYTRRVPAYDAKARGTTLFPEKLPLAWAEFEKAIDADAERAQQMRVEIEAMLVELDDKSLRGQVETFLKAYPDELLQTRTKLAARIEKKRIIETETGAPPAVAAAAASAS